MTPAEKNAVVARATLAAVEACRTAQTAITAALASGNELGAVVPGWVELQRAGLALDAVTTEHSRCVVLARAELGLTNAKGA